MHDIKDIRKNPEKYRDAQRKRGQDPSVIDEVLGLDEQIRAIKTVEQNMQSKLNKLTEQYGKAKREGASEWDLAVIQFEMTLVEIDAHIEKMDMRIAFMDKDQRKMAKAFCAAAGMEYNEETDYETFREAICGKDGQEAAGTPEAGVSADVVLPPAVHDGGTGDPNL
jgi:seryl-tRNA synthetase